MVVVRVVPGHQGQTQAQPENHTNYVTILEEAPRKHASLAGAPWKGTHSKGFLQCGQEWMAVMQPNLAKQPPQRNCLIPSIRKL